jgi:hypothetical protein
LDESLPVRGKELLPPEQPAELNDGITGRGLHHLLLEAVDAYARLLQLRQLRAEVQREPVERVLPVLLHAVREVLGRVRRVRDADDAAAGRADFRADAA